MFSNIALAADEIAQSTGSLIEGSALMNFVPIILIFLIFYFLLIRPQIKKQKEQQALINSVKSGDQVIIAGGIVGTYLKEEGNIAEIALSKDVRVKALKNTITSVSNKDKVNAVTPKEKNTEVLAVSATQSTTKAKKTK